MTLTLRSGAISRRFVMFLVAGGINTLFGYTVFALLVWLGTPNTPAVVLSTAIGILFNFKTFGKVFAASGLARLPHFAGIYAVNMVVNAALLHILTRAGMGAYLAEALIIAALAPCLFLAMRNLVFRAPAETAS